MNLRRAFVLRPRRHLQPKQAWKNLDRHQQTRLVRKRCYLHDLCEFADLQRAKQGHRSISRTQIKTAVRLLVEPLYARRKTKINTNVRQGYNLCHHKLLPYPKKQKRYSVSEVCKVVGLNSCRYKDVGDSHYLGFVGKMKCRRSSRLGKTLSVLKPSQNSPHFGAFSFRCNQHIGRFRAC